MARPGFGPFSGPPQRYSVKSCAPPRQHRAYSGTRTNVGSNTSTVGLGNAWVIGCASVGGDGSAKSAVVFGQHGHPADNPTGRRPTRSATDKHILFWAIVARDFIVRELAGNGLVNPDWLDTIWPSSASGPYSGHRSGQIWQPAAFRKEDKSGQSTSYNCREIAEGGLQGHQRDRIVGCCGIGGLSESSRRHMRI